jgi:hypothetical protein
MRALLTLATLLFASTAWADDPWRGRTRDDVEVRSLNANQLERYAAPYYPMIRACYLEHGRKSPGATGDMTLRLVIHRAGYIRDVDVVAPGVRPRHLRKLENCIRVQVVGWRFPVRRDYTFAVLPYRFQFVPPPPGAGPQYGCWDPRGCPTRAARRAPPARRR